jgi:LacI family transcriptional regulator
MVEEEHKGFMATIHDVAKKAQVSISTVSRVLNGTAFVNSDIRKRVEEAMQELAYQPSPAARSLRVNRSRIIGLLISDLQNPFFMSLTQGVEDEVYRNEYSLLLCNSHEDPQRERQYLDILCAERVAGVIIVPTREHLKTGLADFRKHNIPIVAVDRRIKDNNIDAVLVDNLLGAREAIAHLIQNGYRRIGAITGLQSITTGRERTEGYRQALEEAGLPFDASLVRSGTFQRESGYRLAQELLEIIPPIDALFAGNNMIGMGALDVIHEKHLRVPEDLAFIVYDELPWVVPGFGGLTTVDQPVYDLGRAAAQCLFQRLQKSGPQSRQEIILTPRLTIRNSSHPRGEIEAVTNRNTGSSSLCD